MNIDRILIEIDPRKTNEPAIARAHACAKKFDAAVEVLAYESLPPLAGSSFVGADIVEETRSAFIRDLRDWAKTLVKPLQDDGIDIAVESSWEQPHYEILLERARQTNADLVIRVASRHGRLGRMFLGAADWELIRHIEQPLWLVQSEDESVGSLNFLAAVDPTHPDDHAMALDRRVLDSATTLADALSGSMHVYHAIPTSSTMMPFSGGGESLAPPVPEFQSELAEEIRAAHRSKLGELLDSFGLGDDRVHVVEGEPATAISDVIDANEIDVVVAGAISRSWFERLLIGSTAESLFNTIDCDLLVIRAGQEDAEPRS